jgi:two-component system, OmpR family, phosphate regulon sensor histidine kinase PhoR
MFFWRYFLPLLLMLAGGLLSVWTVPAWLRHDLPVELHTGLASFSALLGACAGFVFYQWLDSAQMGRFLAWLRQADLEQQPGLRGIWQDVLERTRRSLRQEQKAKREETRKLQEFLLALQASPNGVILLDEANQIEWFNQTAATLFGLHQGQDERQTIEHLIRHPGFVEYLHGDDFAQEWTMERAGPGGLLTQVSVQIHTYGNGRKLILGRDVTHMARAEAMRRDFVANVSHELRTPLTVLNGFVETLQHLPLKPDEQKQYLELMSQQGQRMKSLVEDLLTLSRLEASALPGLAESFDLVEMLQQCTQEASTLSAGRHQINFDLPNAQRSIQISGSSLELHSAFSNLISNAIRYTPEGESIQVSWQMDPADRGVFKVSDSGPGIAPEHIPRLTERFYRVDKSRSRETGGTGLGLAIVKHVVQRHGGELLVDSQLGVGSTFQIRLPAARLKLPSA